MAPKTATPLPDVPDFFRLICFLCCLFVCFVVSLLCCLVLCVLVEIGVRIIKVHIAPQRIASWGEAAAP